MLIEILTTTEAAQYVRLGKPTLERFRLTGEGPNFCRLGGAIRYRRVDLDTWLESRLASPVMASGGFIAAQ
jgi:excisionase family DNA binding protein